MEQEKCVACGKLINEVLEVEECSFCGKCPKCNNGNMELICDLKDHGFKNMFVFECKNCEKEKIDEKSKTTFNKLIEIIKQLEYRMGSNSNFGQIVDERIFLVYKK